MADYEYEHEDDYEPRVLWGRIAFYVVGLALAFLAGQCLAGGGDGDSADLTAARRQVQALASDNAVLEQRLAASQQAASEAGEGGGDGGDDGGGNDGGGNEEEPTEAQGQDPVDEEGQTYTVVSGDTLLGIAGQFYEDPRANYERIAEANNLDRDDPLQVGQELVIPPEE